MPSICQVCKRWCKKHCKRGHFRLPHNTIYDAKGYPVCLICRRDREFEYYHAKHPNASVYTRRRSSVARAAAL